MKFPGYGICSFVFIYKVFQNILCHAINSPRKNVKNQTPWRVFHARLCSPYFQFYQQHPYIMLSPIPSQLCGVHFYAHNWKRWASQENLPKILPEFDVIGSCNGCLFLRDSSPRVRINGWHLNLVFFRQGGYDCEVYKEQIAISIWIRIITIGSPAWKSLGQIPSYGYLDRLHRLHYSV